MTRDEILQDYEEALAVSAKHHQDNIKEAREVLHERLKALREKVHEDLKAIRVIDQKTKRNK